MSKTFDATLNAMIDETLGDWADFLADRVGVPRGPAVALDTDLSTSLQADRLFRVEGDPPTRRVVLAWRRSFTRYEAIAALRNAIFACELPGVKRLS